MFAFIWLAANFAELPAAIVVLKVSPARSGKKRLSSYAEVVELAGSEPNPRRAFCPTPSPPSGIENVPAGFTLSKLSPRYPVGSCKLRYSALYTACSEKPFAVDIKVDFSNFVSGDPAMWRPSLVKI